MSVSEPNSPPWMPTTMLRAIGLAFLAGTALAPPAQAQLRPLPKTPDESYAVGQVFAQCSARIAFVADAAHRSGLENNAKLAEGVSRGWKFAGMVILADGLAPSRQVETEQTFDALVENKLDQLRAEFEFDPSGATKNSLIEFEKECEPWAPTQKKLVEVMRRSPAK